MGYTKSAIKGVSWMAAFRVSTRAISLVKTLILARILLPEQFGAYGVALLVLSFLEVMTETGVNVILIQEKKIEKYINSAWIISIIRGFVISFCIIIFAPFISDFFHSPDSKILLYAISIVPFIRGFINPSVVKFQKELNFKKEFWYRSSVFYIEVIVGIIVSIITNSPIGIIVGIIAGALSENVLSYIIAKPMPTFSLNREYIGKIIRRGKWIIASGIFNYLFHNVDNVVVGRLLSTSLLGVYQMSYSLSILPITEISDVFSRVTFPVYARIAGDRDRLRKAFIKTTIVIAVLATPFGLILYFFPKEIVYFILGKNWIAVASILPILGIFGVIRAISGSTSALFLSIGKQEYVTVVTFASILGLIVSIVPLVQNYGLMGAAVSALIGSLVALPFMTYYSWRVFYK